MQPIHVAAILVLLGAAPSASAQAASAEDLTPCPGTHSEPAQSASWGVAFCNRTGHDVVIQFHENDCPVENWAHRGDVYEETMSPGETKTFLLCYANETQKLAPGVPQLRLPGGKGVVTTWSVVGDCGERSNRSKLDARSFYDRGDYKTGIILLQHPATAAHCVASAADQSAAAHSQRPSRTASAAPSVATPGAPAGPSPGVPSTPSPAMAAAPSPAGLAAVPRSANGSTPSLRAVIDSTDRFTRTVRIFATSSAEAPGYSCRFMLALNFSDGSSWNDRVQTDVHAAADNSLVATRKYGKSVTKVELSGSRCTAL